MFQQAMFDDTAGNLIRHPEGPEVDRIWNFEHFPISVRFFLKFPHSIYSRMTIYIVLYLCLCPYLYLYVEGTFMYRMTGFGKKSFQDL